jgi:hypothetical protein
LVENKMRASANVIHPRSSGGNADKERVSAASVVPSSLVASGAAAASAPNSHPIRLVILISEFFLFCYARESAGPLKI